jgi:hypothetical protein
MFDSNAMHELAALSRDRYQRAGGGGAFKVYASSKAFDESRGYKEMTVWQRAVYETNQLWKSDSRSAVAGFKWDCHALTLDRDANGDIPF